MPVIGDIYVAKEAAQTFQPLLLAEFKFPDGSYYRTSTHALDSTYAGSSTFEYGGNKWDPRIQNQDFADTQAMSDLGVDVSPSVTIVLADADKLIYSSQEFIKGFKGARLTIYSVMADMGTPGTGSFSSNSPAPIKFIGTCGPANADQGSLVISATSLLNFTQKQMPTQRIQQICSWSFPPNQSSRSAAVGNLFSIFYNCGYSYGEAGGVGNPETGTAAFQFCDFTRFACIQRLGNPGLPDPPPAQTGIPPLMFDTFGNPTGRFGGYEWVPPASSGKQRPYVSGNWEDLINAANDAKYGDYMPLCYGTTWVDPLIMGTWGDGNYTNFEVAVCAGQVNRIHKVLVNGIEVMQFSPDTDAGYRPAPNHIGADATIGSVKNGYWKTINDGGRNGVPSPNPGWGRQGDPYGSVTAIYVSVLRQVAPENSVPSIQVLLDGISVVQWSDINTSIKAFSTNPAWHLMDLMFKAGWSGDGMNTQSFIDAAADCDVVMNFDSMTGDYQNFYNESGYPSFRRFSSGFTVRQRIGFGDLVRGVRSCMRAMLYFDFNTGLLTVRVKKTLAEQQSAPIIGSNYNAAVSSVLADGTPASGYAAYAFDFDSIMRDSSGKSTLKVVQRSLQESPNKTTLSFLNRENSYGSDSVTVIDIEDFNRIGQEVVGSLPVIGIQTFDHARRILNTWLAENYRGNGRLDYLGSAIGDTGGTSVFEFQTSVKALHLMVGQLVLISDAQLGISQQLARLVRIKPSTNFETATLTAQWHNDNWYQDTFGQSEQPIYGPAQGLANRAPYSWRPGLTIPMSGDAYYSQTDLGFDVYPQYSLAADNSGIANIIGVGKIPVNSFQTNLKRPKLEITGEQASGGGYPSDRTYWAAVSEKGDNTTAAPMSATSPPVMVKLDPSHDSLQFVAQAWPGSPSGYVAFAGLDPLAMSFQGEFTGTTAVVSMSNAYNDASWGPPDEVLSNFLWRVTKIRHGGPWGEGIPYNGTPPFVTPSSIVISVFENMGFVPNEWAGREVSVYGLAARGNGDTSTPIPIANFNVSGNTGNTLNLSSGDPTTCVSGGSLGSGDVMVMRFLPTYGEDTIGKYFEDLLLVNELNPLYDVRMVSQATDTSPIVLTLDLSQGETFPFQAGDWVVASGIKGNLAANGGFTVAAVDAANNTVTLAGSSGNGTYTIGGILGHQVRGLNINDEIGNLVMIIAGTGLGTFVRIKSNTATRIYIDGDWPIAPDSTTRLIIIEPVPVVQVPGLYINNAIRELVAPQSVQVSNYDNTSLLVHPAMQARSAKLSHVSLDPFREMYMIGNPLLSAHDVPGDAPFTLRAEGYAMLTVNDLQLPKSAYAIKEMNFVALSLDETDPMCGSGTIDAVTDPAVISPGVNGFAGRFGTTFRIGDYIVWNDPGAYEVDQIIGLSGGNYVVRRRDPGALAGQALFGSVMAAHSGSLFFKGIPRMFSQAIRQNTFGTPAPTTMSGLPEKWEWAWPNKCIVAVSSQAIGDLGAGPVQTLNTTNPNIISGASVGGVSNSPPCPGLRTMSGAAYTNLGISGPIVRLQTADRRVPVQAWETIRCVYGTVLVPPTGSGLVVAVMYITSNLAVAALVDILVFASGASTNYASGGGQPNQRQMPYHQGGWAGLGSDWPPNVLPVCAGALTGGVLNGTVSPGSAVIQMAPDGFLDAVIIFASLPTPPEDLVITVQT